MTEQTIKFYQVGSFAVGNRLVDPQQRTVQSDRGRWNSLTSGHRACQGCGEALGARYVLDAAMAATDGQMIVVNATGCLGSLFRRSSPSLRGGFPGIHSVFGNAAAVGTGVAAALKAAGDTKTRVVVVAGDGGAVDIGFGCLSGMFERDDDVLFVCYDNEAYMKPACSAPARRPPRRAPRRRGRGARTRKRLRQGKEPALLAIAHGIPYVATATVADLHDLEAKVRAGHGAPRGALSPRPRSLPARLGIGPDETIHIARLASETGLFPLFEAATAGSSSDSRSAASSRSRRT